MTQFTELGFEIIPEIYSGREIDEILKLIQKRDFEKAFGARAFLQKMPELMPLIFSSNLKNFIQKIAPNARLIKSIYFDKPPHANWILNWHQDLTINVNAKKEAEGFKNWRVLKDRTVVQPPREILENIFTIRIHLDNCTKQNGALRVIPKSHSSGVISVKNELENWLANEHICEVEKGGVLLMRPLILHASRRTENDLNRRVIHLEFYDKDLPSGINWAEGIDLRTMTEYQKHH